MPAPETEPDLVARDLRSMLDQEVAALAEIYRLPIVLCYFQGKTHAEAARLLGCPKGTLAARLARARQRLRQRLTRRGWAYSAEVLAGVMTASALTTTVEAQLIRATVRSALAFASGESAAVLSAKAVALAEGVLRVMWYGKMKILSGVLLAVLLTGTGIGLLARHTWAGSGPKNPQGAVQTKPTPPNSKPKAQDDPKAEIAKLRDEMGKLHSELAAALKEIKDLKSALRPSVPSPDDGPLYRGKPLRFWLEQLKDVDPKFRGDAVQALGIFANKNKKLIAVLSAYLKDEDYEVGAIAAVTLGALGPEVVPVLGEVLKDKATPWARGQVARALFAMGPRGKPAVPLLIQILKEKQVLNKRAKEDEERWIRSGVLETFGGIGPAARPAIPALIELMGESLQSSEDKKGDRGRGFPPIDHILRVMVKIDPELDRILPGELRGLEFRAVSANDATFRQAYKAVKKRYQQR